MCKDFDALWVKKKVSLHRGCMNTVNILSTIDVVDGLVCLDVGVLEAELPTNCLARNDCSVQYSHRPARFHGFLAPELGIKLTYFSAFFI